MPLYEFPAAAVTNYHNVMAYNNTNSFFYSSGGLLSDPDFNWTKIMVLAELCSSLEALVENLFP